MENQEVKNANEVNTEGLKSAKPTLWDRIKAHKGAAIAAAVAVGTVVVGVVGHALRSRSDDDTGEEDNQMPEQESGEE